jgi:hypothetical protein
LERTAEVTVVSATECAITGLHRRHEIGNHLDAILDRLDAVDAGRDLTREILVGLFPDGAREDGIRLAHGNLEIKGSQVRAQCVCRPDLGFEARLEHFRRHGWDDDRVGTANGGGNA